MTLPAVFMLLFKEALILYAVKYVIKRDVAFCGHRQRQ
jgi:hypothetical protein